VSVRTVRVRRVGVRRVGVRPVAVREAGVDVPKQLPMVVSVLGRLVPVADEAVDVREILETVVLLQPTASAARCTIGSTAGARVCVAAHVPIQRDASKGGGIAHVAAAAHSCHCSACREAGEAVSGRCRHNA